MIRLSHIGSTGTWWYLKSERRTLGSGSTISSKTLGTVLSFKNIGKHQFYKQVPSTGYLHAQTRSLPEVCQMFSKGLFVLVNQCYILDWFPLVKPLISTTYPSIYNIKDKDHSLCFLRTITLYFFFGQRERMYVLQNYALKHRFKSLWI